MAGQAYPRMDGRVCLITGATSGIGRAAALELGRLGATMVLLARSRERAGETRRAIEEADGTAEVILADLSSLEQVREAAAAFTRRFDRLDVLVHDAGVYTRERTLGADGIELQFQVNHISPFLLTRLLLPTLRASAPARIVVVSSEAHRGTTMNWDDLTGERGYRGLKAYAQSKLANLLFTSELARRLEGSGVTANALHPGVVGTEILFGGWAPLRLLRPFLRTPEKGAETVVYLAASTDVEGVSGGYFKDRAPIRPSDAARDPESARRLWEASDQMLRAKNALR